MCHINTGEGQICLDLNHICSEFIKLNHICSSELNHICCSGLNHICSLELNHICSSESNHICSSVSMRWSPAARQNLPDEYFISSHCCLRKYGEDEETGKESRIEIKTKWVFFATPARMTILIVISYIAPKWPQFGKIFPRYQHL